MKVFRTISVLVVCLLCCRATPVAFAQDWPQFRGPEGQGTSLERDVPFEWSETSNVAWKAKLPGLGWSSPVVAGGKVWVTTATEERSVSLRDRLRYFHR